MPPHQHQIPHVGGSWKGRPAEFRSDRLVVAVKPGYPVHATLTEISHQIHSSLHIPVNFVVKPGRRWAVFRFNPHPNASTTIPQVAELIALDERIKYAEPSVIGHSHLNPGGDFALQTWAKTIGLETAWSMTTGTKSVLLAILDSGISMTASTPDHPDLKGTRFITKRGTINNDYLGTNYDEVPRDEHLKGHGTHLAGIASAIGTDSLGIAGVNWNCPVYVARVIDACDNVASTDVLEAVHDLLDYASGSYDRVVVNMSFGTMTEVDHFRDMCDQAQASPLEVLFVCGAGGVDDSHTDVDFPAALASEYTFVVSVGATTGDTYNVYMPLRDDYSKITIFAPGSLIYSTLPTYDRQCVDSHGVTQRGTDKNYGKESGSSMAAAMVSGVASLMWAVNDGLSAEDIIDLLKAKAKSFTYTQILRNPDDSPKAGATLTHIRLNASDAVMAALPHVEIEETHVLFADVAVGDPVEQCLVFAIGSDCTVDFEVVAGSITGLPPTLTIAPLSAQYTPDMGGECSFITITYLPTAAGTAEYAEFKIRCMQANCEWTVYITANSAVDTTCAAMIVADRSSSMAEPSGITALTRMQVLQEAAGIVVETMRVGDSLGVDGFSSTAATTVPATDITGEDPASGERTMIKTRVAGLAIGGTTSVGAGVKLAAGMLAGTSRATRGMIVLTDGHENTPPFILDVMETITTPVYAIGMGTAEVIQPDTLEALTAKTGGYLLLTDTLNNTARFKVAKYALQMLSDIMDESVVLDPATALRPRQRLSIPFPLCADDRACEVMLLTPWPDLVKMTVTAPNGTVVETRGRGTRRFAGTCIVGHRFLLPVMEAHAGTYHVVLEIADEQAERVLLERCKARGKRVPSMPCSVMVTAKSSVRMKCRALTASTRPGSRVTLRATLSRRGQGYDARVRVAARIRKRGEHASSVQLMPVGNGVFEGTFTASSTGVYECVIRATGTTPDRQRFRREQTVTAQVWPETALCIEPARARALEVEGGAW